MKPVIFIVQLLRQYYTSGLFCSIKSFSCCPSAALSVNLLTRGISFYSERKIDQIENRLSGIERLLQQLVSSQSRGSNISSIPNNSQAGQAHETHTLQVPTPSVDRIPLDSSSPGDREGPGSERGTDAGTSNSFVEPEETFEGNSSLAAHTAFASEFCKQRFSDGGILFTAHDVYCLCPMNVLLFKKRRSFSFFRICCPESDHQSN